jgi:HSP20 family protein
MSAFRDKPSDAGTAGNRESTASGMSAAAGTEQRTERPGARPSTEGTTAGTTAARAGETQRAVPVGSDVAESDVSRRGGRGVGTSTGIGWPSFFRSDVAASPWELLRQMNDEMNHIWENVGYGRMPFAPLSQSGAGLTRGSRLSPIGGSTASTILPDVEVIQRPNALVLRADLPGLDSDDINVQVEDGTLILSGERKREQREEREGFVRSEVRYGTFYRAIPLPRDADEDKISASFKNGVLEVTVPVEENERARKIAVKT